MPAYNRNMYDLSGATWRALLKGTVVIILVRTEPAILITCLMAVLLIILILTFVLTTLYPIMKYTAFLTTPVS